MSYDHYRSMKSIGTDDYEESALLHRFNELMRSAEKYLSMPPSLREKPERGPSGLTSDQHDERDRIVRQLGYDPVAGRVSRPRGPARRSSIPSPLPEPGTKLRSCLDDVYVIVGYAKTPRALEGTPTAVLYNFNGDLITRSLPNLFAGSLASGEPIVTWPGDNRRLKPKDPMPVKFRRTMTRAQIKAEREGMDEDLKQARVRDAKRLNFGRHVKKTPN